MINHWDEIDENWVTHYGVRYGKWKFLNFRRENFGHYRCEEGWQNDAHFRYLFPQKKAREAMTRDFYNGRNVRTAKFTNFYVESYINDKNPFFRSKI